MNWVWITHAILLVLKDFTVLFFAHVRMIKNRWHHLFHWKFTFMKNFKSYDWYNQNRKMIWNHNKSIPKSDLCAIWPSKFCIHIKNSTPFVCGFVKWESSNYEYKLWIGGSISIKWNILILSLWVFLTKTLKQIQHKFLFSSYLFAESERDKRSA